MTAFNLNRREMLFGSSLSVLGLAFMPKFSMAGDVEVNQVKWLDNKPPEYCNGHSFGVPFAPGKLKKTQVKQTYLSSDTGIISDQTWPLAYWPDGSIKWLGVAVPPQKNPAAAYKIKVGAFNNKTSLKASENAGEIIITDDNRKYIIAKSGNDIIKSAMIGAHENMKSLRLVAKIANGANHKESAVEFTSLIKSAKIEQSGNARIVVKIEGVHSGQSREVLPFVIRLYFYQAAENIKVVHSFIYDLNPQKDFICGMGFNAIVPMDDEMYNRHIRLSGAKNGLFAEAVRPLTGLRRDSGQSFRDAQIKGEKISDITGMPAAVKNSLDLIPMWGDFKLNQLSPDGFTIKKRTDGDHAYIDAIASERSSGLAYVGGGNGGIGIGIKNFWQRYPAGLEIRNAHTDNAEIYGWLWSPDAEPMDMRPYRAEGKATDYKTQNDTLNITYEDYEAGWDDAYGIAHSAEYNIWVFDKTPSKNDLGIYANLNQSEPRLLTTPEAMKAAGVFGAWSLPQKGNETINNIESRINYQIDYYKNQIEQQRWYGFWNYGDVMHTYDADRHSWRYDIGGYAWDNSELSTDLWLWMSFVRGGRADLFRMAESMTRQTCETDVYHIGKYKGFGTRHGVQPFSDSSKQPRVSNVAYRRIYYYLTADERVGDIMYDLRNSEYTIKNVDISRKLGKAKVDFGDENIVLCGFGTSWGSFLAAWMTQWERSNDNIWRDRILNGMTTIGAMKNGWFNGEAPFDLKSGKFIINAGGNSEKISVSHLNCVFGIFETQCELFDLLDNKATAAYRQKWFEYCKYYNAPDAEIKAFLGEAPKGRALRVAHSRLSAWAGVYANDAALKARAVHEFLYGESRNDSGPRTELQPHTKAIMPPDVIHEIDEDISISTNDSAQWGLAAIANLALLRDELNATAVK